MKRNLRGLLLFTRKVLAYFSFRRDNDKRGYEFNNTGDHLLANLEGNRAWRYDKDCYASSHKNRTSQQEQER